MWNRIHISCYRGWRPNRLPPLLSSSMEALVTAKFSRISHVLNITLAAAALLFLCAGSARAQAPADNSGAIKLTKGADVPSVYFFRGIRQESDAKFTTQ